MWVNEGEGEGFKLGILKMLKMDIKNLSTNKHQKFISYDKM